MNSLDAVSSPFTLSDIFCFGVNCIRGLLVIIAISLIVLVFYLSKRPMMKFWNSELKPVLQYIWAWLRYYVNPRISNPLAEAISDDEKDPYS